MNRFDACWFGVAVMALCCQACCNIGCRYDLRRYPTPIMSGGTPRAHLWNPDACATDAFDKLIPPGYQNTAATAAPPAKLPVGPAVPKAELQPPVWSDPLRGGATLSTSRQE